ncbi:MAG: ribonuclease P protein component [Candidatus Staskawiczbacteria bacterium]|nr:ribonuclease P protein component [Candidatus Staskawiczbacteria bacterium]
MLSKINRIKKKKDFEIIFKNSKSFKNNLFIFKIKRNDLGLNRFGFVVSHKVSKKATVRNKIRRRLADLMRKKTTDIKTGVDLVIITLPGIEKKTFSDLKEAINTLFIKSGLMSGKI